MEQNNHLHSKQAFSFYNENWLPILENNVANILPGYYISNYGKVYNSRRNLMLSVFLDKDGYKRVNVFITDPITGNIVSKQKMISRLVKQAFDPIENPDQYEVHHIDRNIINNHIDNLQWISPEEHQRITKETWPKGKESKLYGPNGSNVKLTGDQVIDIKNKIINGDYTNLNEIAKFYNVNETCIWAIVHNVNWEDYGPKITVDNLRVSSGFTNQEIENICKYFETHDINNRSIYPNMKRLISECYFSLKLDQKYGANVESKRKLITHILLKNSKYIKRITDKYSYVYIKGNN